MSAAPGDADDITGEALDGTGTGGADLYRRVFDAIPAPLYVTRVDDGVVLLANAAVAGTGYTAEQMIGRSVLDLDLWADVGQRSEILSLLRGNGSVTAFPARLRRRDGAIIDVVASIQGIDIGGRPCIVTVFHDVTERTGVEAALHRSERRFRQIAESVNDGFVLASMNPLHVRYASPAAAKLLGLEVADVYAGMDRVITAIHPDDRPALWASHDRASAGVESDEVDVRVQGSGTDARWVRVRWTTTDGELDGDNALIAAVFEDVTARKRAERDVDVARALADEANQARSAFLSRASHELRTPLNVILGFGQLLRSAGHAPADEQALDEIISAGEHLLLLVDEVIDISDADAGELDLVAEAVAVDDVIDDVIEDLTAEAARCGVELRADRRDGHTVRGDPDRLREALRQIVHNAVVHNVLAGSVQVRTEPRPRGRVRITVEDTGPGLSADDLERVYLPFERTQGTDGTGLGLTLSRRLVEAMDGELGARSAPGSGSQFWIELDEASPTTVASRRPEAGADPPGPRRRVLYIEDNASNAELAARLLGGRRGFDLVIAECGQEGLDLLGTQAFDLLLLDLHLPDVAGEEILRQVRTDPALGGPPVIVVSADASPDVIRRVTAAGAVEYLTKPFDIAHLVQVVEQHSDPSSRTGELTAPSVPPPSAGDAPPDPDGGPVRVIDEQMFASLQVLEEIQPGSVKDLVELFTRLGTERLEAMERLAAGEGVEGIAALAHTLRGGGANLGAAALATSCRRLERAAGSEDAGRVRSELADVRRTFEAAVSELAARVGPAAATEDRPVP